MKQQIYLIIELYAVFLRHTHAFKVSIWMVWLAWSVADISSCGENGEQQFNEQEIDIK